MWVKGGSFWDRSISLSLWKKIGSVKREQSWKCAMFYIKRKKYAKRVNGKFKRKVGLGWEVGYVFYSSLVYRMSLTSHSYFHWSALDLCISANTRKVKLKKKKASLIS